MSDFPPFEHGDETVKNDFLTIKELAARLNVKRATVWLWIDSGYIKAYRSGPSPYAPWRIPIAEAEKLIKEHSPAAATRIETA